jgi:hypothetical protein
MSPDMYYHGMSPTMYYHGLGFSPSQGFPVAVILAVAVALLLAVAIAAGLHSRRAAVRQG